MALVLALAMVLAMGTVAFAADDTYKGSGDSNATGVAGKTTIPLIKGIVFFNANGSAVYEPNITFSYEVTPDTAIAADGTTASVTDDGSLNVILGTSTPVTRNVYPGPDGGVIGTSISFSAANTAVTATATGTEAEQSGNLTFVPSAFSKPGIYRYVITERVSGTGTDAENLAAAGLTARDTSYDTTRYLDVYVKNGDSGLEMYGAVIFKSASTTPGQDDIDTITEKTTGFEPGSDGVATYDADRNVDKYTTYDFTVKKTVSGSMADKNHEFPFFVTVSNSINGAKFTYTADSTETFAGANNANGVITLSAADFSIGSDEITSTLKLKNNDTVKLVGVPSNQTDDLAVVIKEFNDTYDSYTPSASAVEGTLTMTTGTAMTAQSGSDSTESFSIKDNDTADQVLTINNNLSEISPTGVVLRIAPYALMLAAGIVLLIVSRRRKAQAED